MLKTFFEKRLCTPKLLKIKIKLKFPIISIGKILSDVPNNLRKILRTYEKSIQEDNK